MPSCPSVPAYALVTFINFTSLTSPLEWPLMLIERVEPVKSNPLPKVRVRIPLVTALVIPLAVPQSTVYVASVFLELPW